MERYGPALDWVADQIGDRVALELERMAAALWVTREFPDASVERVSRP